MSIEVKDQTFPPKLTIPPNVTFPSHNLEGWSKTKKWQFLAFKKNVLKIINRGLGSNLSSQPNLPLPPYGIDGLFFSNNQKEKLELNIFQFMFLPFKFFDG